MRLAEVLVRSEDVNNREARLVLRVASSNEFESPNDRGCKWRVIVTARVHPHPT
jgi:hypothetical protein